MEQWLKDNSGFVIGVASSIVGTIIVGLVAFFVKPIRFIIVSLWAHVRRLRIFSAAESLDLRFVPMPWRSTLGVVRRDGEQPMADIRTRWNVTNLSPPGMPPARLLTARLVEPRLRDARLPGAPTEGTNAMVVSVHGELIPRGYTREVDIHFFVVLPSGRLNKPMKIKIVVTDQLANEHKPRPIRLKPMIIEGTQTPPGTS
jgi:hypothetical protein